MPITRSLFIISIYVFAIFNLDSHYLMANDDVKACRNIDFSLLDKKQINTGILYDKVVSLSRIDDYSGNEHSKSTTLKNWQQMYFEMCNASLEPPHLPTIRYMNTSAKKQCKRTRQSRFQEIITIAVMNFKFNQIKHDAFDKGLLEIENNQIKRSSKSTESPFEEKRVFASTTLKETTYRGNDVIFMMGETFYFSNDNNPPIRFELDFNDGNGFRNVCMGDRVNIHYSETGTKNIQLKSYDTNKNVLKSNFTFHVKSLSTPDPHIIFPVRGEIPYEENTASGEFFVYHSDKTSILSKPIIFVEGIDYDNSRGWDELYHLLNHENLLEGLRSEGNDLVVLNFEDSTDYIQRNAFLFIKMINQVNALKNNNNDLIVIGASMGGLVSRYALAYMEKNGLPHNTNLFISFDSPHRGANIPLGDQYMLPFFSGESSEVSIWIDRLNSPAAKQMLVYHYSASVSDDSASRICISSTYCFATKICGYPYIPKPHNSRNILLEELSYFGFPQKTRTVAMSNGSGYGIGLSFMPGDQLVKYSYHGFWVALKSNTYALPDNTSVQKIFHGEIDKFGPSCERTATWVHQSLPYDNAPGGMADTNKQIADVSAPFGNIYAINDNHCFIPTISALDIDTDDLFHHIAYDANILNKTPFDAIYYPYTNENHVSINDINANWIRDEIQNAQSQSNTAKPGDLNGDGKLDLSDAVRMLLKLVE